MFWSPYFTLASLGYCTHLPLSLPTPHTRMLTIGCEWRSVCPRGSIRFSISFSSTSSMSLPWRIQHQVSFIYITRVFLATYTNIHVSKHLYTRTHTPLPRCRLCRAGCVCGMRAAWCSYWQQCCFFQVPSLPQISRPSPEIAQQNTTKDTQQRRNYKFWQHCMHNKIISN